MEYVSDLILAAASLGAAAYCVVLSRRLKALGSLEGGMGTAIAVLSSQVDDLTRSLKGAQDAAGRTGGRLDAQASRAEAVARKLELLLASMHDLPEEAPAPAPAAAAPRAARSPSAWPAAATPSKRPALRVADDDMDQDDLADAAPRARVVRRRTSAGAL